MSRRFSNPICLSLVTLITLAHVLSYGANQDVAALGDGAQRTTSPAEVKPTTHTGREVSRPSRESNPIASLHDALRRLDRRSHSFSQLPSQVAAIDFAPASRVAWHAHLAHCSPRSIVQQQWVSLQI